MSKDKTDLGMPGGRWQLLGRLGVNSAPLPGLEVHLRTLATRALELMQSAALTASQHETSKFRQAKVPTPTPHFAAPVPGAPRRRQDLIPNR